MRDILRLIFKAISMLALIAGAVLLITKFAAAGDYRSNFSKIPVIDNSPIRAGNWQSTPTVVVCPYAPVSRDQIKKAVSVWKKLGHPFFQTQYKYDPLDKCNQSTPVGYIAVHLVKQEHHLNEDSLAETHFFVNNDDGSIEWAIIYVKKDVRETVLEHEIGHALGYLHYDRINHLMNSKWTQGGWETTGLRNKPR